MEEKRINKHGLGLAPDARREKFLTLLHGSPSICSQSQACIRAKFPHSIRNVDSSSHVGQSGLGGPHRLLFSSADCPVQSCSLLSSVLSGTFLPASSSGPVGYFARKPFMWVSRQDRQRNLLIGTYPQPQPHPHNECPHYVTHVKCVSDWIKHNPTNSIIFKKLEWKDKRQKLLWIFL